MTSQPTISPLEAMAKSIQLEHADFVHGEHNFVYEDYSFLIHATDGGGVEWVINGEPNTPVTKDSIWVTA